MANVLGLVEVKLYSHSQGNMIYFKMQASVLSVQLHKWAVWLIYFVLFGSRSCDITYKIPTVNKVYMFSVGLFLL